jgi:hypothetical protein
VVVQHAVDKGDCCACASDTRSTVQHKLLEGLACRALLVLTLYELHSMINQFLEDFKRATSWSLPVWPPSEVEMFNNLVFVLAAQGLNQKLSSIDEISLFKFKAFNFTIFSIVHVIYLLWEVQRTISRVFIFASDLMSQSDDHGDSFLKHAPPLRILSVVHGSLRGNHIAFGLLVA